MKPIEIALLGIVLALVGILLRIVGLRPSEWKASLTAWRQLVLRARDVQIFAKRVDWDGRHLLSIIQDSTELIIITSYEGEKHWLWEALERRFKDRKPFDLTFLRLKRDSHFLRACLNVTKADHRVTDDRARLGKLERINRELPPGERKTFKSGVWDGISPGQVVCWMNGSKTTVAFGPWLQVEGCTDLTPWVVITRGPLFEPLRLHCKVLKNTCEPDNWSDAELALLR